MNTKTYWNGKEQVRELLTEEEESAKQQREDAHVVKQLDYTANHKYKDDRKKAYGPIGDQLDMLYHDKKNGTTTFVDHIASVKLTYPKPV